MPEYLAPGVYVEETSFRSKSLEGVSTSTAGFVGPTRYGPVSGDPELITSFLDFQRIYGGLDDLDFSDVGAQTNYLAHGVRAFFEEGGKRLYISRAFNFGDSFRVDNQGVPSAFYAYTDNALSYVPNPKLTLRARYPGSAGNMRVTFSVRTGANAFNPADGGSLSRVRSYDVVHIRSKASPHVAVHGDGLFSAFWDPVAQVWRFKGNGSELTLSSADLAGTEIRPVTILVDVESPSKTPGSGGFESAQSLGEFVLDNRTSSNLGSVFTRNPPTRFQALTIPFAIEGIENLSSDPDTLPLELLRELLGTTRIDALRDDRPAPTLRYIQYTLHSGSDGKRPDDTAYAGNDDPTKFSDYINDPLLLPKNGLLAFEGVEDISIVAAPGYTTGYTDTNGPDTVMGIQNALINHCEKMRYRIAVLDTPKNFLPTEALTYRNLRSSKYAAIYYPWIIVADPLSDGRLSLPPSGFVAGVYARNDIEHAVFKAPANEVIRLAIDFEQRLNKAQQELLNPQGVNCLRFFSGNGFLLWGARTISDDPEWKYVSLRRYFAYLEHTIDRGTQWVVFENNSRQLWDNVRRTVEDFLFNEWKMGGLLGDKPEQAYFVRCDLSTMTQNDLDNGRLVCLIGVAPVRPAEFVIFRIGQITLAGQR